MVRKPIEKAVDFVVMGAVKGFQKLFGGAIGWVKDKAEKGKAWAVKDKANAPQGPACTGKVKDEDRATRPPPARRRRGRGPRTRPAIA